MKVAFVCCTPYHIILSLHLAQTRYENFQKDIYICDHFDNAYQIYTKTKEDSFFTNTFFVKDHDLNYDRSFLKYKKAYIMLMKDSSYFLNDQIELQYNELCIFTHNLFSKLIYDKLVKHNKNIVLNFVEEGTSTYTLTHLNHNSIKDKTLKTLSVLFNKKFFNNKDLDNLFLFRPDLYSGNIDTNIIKIPEINKGNSLIKEKLNSIFEYDTFKLPYENYKLIYFDQTFSKDGEIPIDEKKMLFEMMENINSEDLVVKLHPRDSKNKYTGKDLKTQSDGSLPWEIIFLNLDLEGKILVTIRSSSVFTPKIMFNKENNIILLYKIAGIKDELYEEFVNKFRQLYNRATIYIPETWEEFRKVVELI